MKNLTGREQMEYAYKAKVVALTNKKPEIKSFLDSLNMEMSSIYAYAQHVSKFLDYVNKPISELEYDDFISYLNKTKKSDDHTDTTSSYRILIYSALKKFSRYCFVSDKIKRDYMADVERPKSVQSQKTIEKRQNGVLSSTELFKYMKNVKTDHIKGAKRHMAPEWQLRDRCIIYLFLTTGLRCSALRNLDLNDVDFQKGKIKVTEKGNKYKEISIANDVLNELSEWVDAREKILQESTENALFISTYRGRISAKSISRIVEKYSKDIEGKHLSPHKLRATFATLLYENTNDIMAVKEALGHANVTTSQLYIRQSKDMSQIASNIMSNVIGL